MDSVILGCDEERSQIKDGLSLRCVKGKQHNLRCDERKEILILAVDSRTE